VCVGDDDVAKAGLAEVEPVAEHGVDGVSGERLAVLGASALGVELLGDCSGAGSGRGVGSEDPCDDVPLVRVGKQPMRGGSMR
jgi:hypothetical protein